MAKQKAAKAPKEIKLNTLAMNRRSKYSMGPIIPDEGWVFTTSDFCFHPDCEYLTPEGWVKVMDLKKGQKVWQVDPETLVGNFVTPLRVIKRHYEGDMITYNTARGSICVTRDHDMFAIRRCHKRKPSEMTRYTWKAGQPIPSTQAHWCCFSYSKEEPCDKIPEEDIWLACVHQGKDFNLDLLPVSQIKLFLLCLTVSARGVNDPNNEKGQSIKWESVNESWVDRIQAYLVRHGYECRKTTWVPEKETDPTYYTLHIRKEGVIRCYSYPVKGSKEILAYDEYTKEIVEPYSGMVGCVTVPTGLIQVRHKGQVFTIKQCSAEPTILLNFTDDPTLYSILYEMNGKVPFWNEQGILMTNSLYITTLSKTSLLGPLLREKPQEWLDRYAVDSDYCKDSLGNRYAIAKMLVLALIYGMQEKRLREELANSDIYLTEQESLQFKLTFWDSMPACRDFRDFLIKEFTEAKKKKMNYVSPFGFIVPTGKPNDAMNYIIQSSVSAWVRNFNRRLLVHNNLFKLVMVMHDELIMSVRENWTEEAHAMLKKCEKETNEQFELPYPLTLGWKVCKNFYGFKEK